MIFCEFDYCIYNKRSACILKVISISPVGFCEDCLIPNIDKEVLEKHKKEMLAKVNRRTINQKLPPLNKLT